MLTGDELQKAHEEKVATLLATLGGKGGPSDWALARALIHKAVHLVADKKAAEFCGVAVFLAEMLTHCHQLMHPGDEATKSHGDIVH